MTLRETVAHLMVARHGISLELAREHTERMDAGDVFRRFRFYASARKSEAELSVDGAQRSLEGNR